MIKFNNMDNSTFQSLSTYLAEVPHKHHFRLRHCFNVAVDRHWDNHHTAQVDDFHLCYVKSGRGSYIINKHKELLRKGKVILITPGSSFSGVPDTSNPPHIIPVRFDLFSNEKITRIRPKIPNQAIAFTPTKPELYAFLFENLFELSRHPDAQASTSTCSSILHVIMSNIRKDWEQLERIDTGIDPRIDRVRLHLDIHPDLRIRSQDLADMANLSLNYFTKLFTQQVGVSPRHYHLIARMRYARYLLEIHDKQVKEVAFELGYTDPYLFSRQFKQIHGQSPQAIKHTVA